MKRILINATHNEEIRVALCKDNHLYDFDLENRTREQKKSNIYKGHVTRVEPSLEAVFVEYGSQRQGFLPIREIASAYLKGNPREENIRKLIKEGDELIVQVEKEERGNKGAALSTYVSLAGRYLVLMPNNPRGGGISRQITGKLREEMKRMLANMDLPKGMSVIVRTAGISKTQEDLQHDLNHLLNIWNAIQEQNEKYPSPRLVHQEAGVVTRAVRDYLRDDISEIWIDNENAYNEAEAFVKAVMPKQIGKLRKYTDYEPMFANFNIEKQIETAYQREVRLPSGGSIVIDQTEALVSIDINSAKSTKGSDVSETAYHTNLEAAEEIARQLRLRDMGGLIVIDFIDMNDSKHQKEVEKRLVDATKYDRARVQFGNISKFGLMEMSRQRLRPSLEESTGYICPRCHGNGMIRDLRSLSLSIMRQIEEIALKQRHGEVQAEVPTDIAAFLLNEKRESLVYLEQDSGTRITILPHAHLDSPNFNLNFNHDGFVPASYERISDTQQQESSERGYDVDWQTNDAERPEQQPTRQPRAKEKLKQSSNQKAVDTVAAKSTPPSRKQDTAATQPSVPQTTTLQTASKSVPVNTAKPQAVAWLSNLFAPTPQASTSANISSQDAADAIEAIVNSGAQSRGVFGDLSATVTPKAAEATVEPATTKYEAQQNKHYTDNNDSDNSKEEGANRRSTQDRHSDDKRKRKNRSHKSSRGRSQDRNKSRHNSVSTTPEVSDESMSKSADNLSSSQNLPKRRQHSKRDSRGSIERGDALTKTNDSKGHQSVPIQHKTDSNPIEVTLRVNEAPVPTKEPEVVHISLDDDADKHNAKDHSVSVVSNADKKQPTTQSDTNTDSVSNKEKDKSSVKVQNIEPKPATTSKKTELKADQSSVQQNSVANTSVARKETAEPEHKDKTLSFDTEDLFATYYVTAHKYGQATNDPRVVKANKAALVTPKVSQALPIDNQSTEASEANSAPIASKSRVSIQGSVGEFIHNTLDDATEQLKSGNVISVFLMALTKVEAQSSADQPTATDNTPVAPTAVDSVDKSLKNIGTHFDFSNYGYEPLSEEYLAKFHTMTTAVAKCSKHQGKAEPIERPLSQRASNDPRGQHPDYQAVKEIEQSATALTSSNNLAEGLVEVEESAALITDTVTDTVNEGNEGNNNNTVVDSEGSTTAPSSQSDVMEKVKQVPDSQLTNLQEAFGRLMSGSVGHFVEQILGEVGTKMLEEGATESAFLTALKQPMSEIMERLQAIDESTNSESKTAQIIASLDDVIHKEAPVEVLLQAVGEVTETVTDALFNLTSDTSESGNAPNQADNSLEGGTMTESKDKSDNENADESNKGNDSDSTSFTEKTETDDNTERSESNKTSIASYKSMIETISEQLSPQTGLFNLTPSKAPKLRSRKSKSDQPDTNSEN